MSLAAYLAVRPSLPPRSPSRWRWLLPLLLLPPCYFACGAVILTLGRWLGWI
jgi:hypothetical protein